MTLETRHPTDLLNSGFLKVGSVPILWWHENEEVIKNYLKKNNYSEEDSQTVFIAKDQLRVWKWDQLPMEFQF